MYLLIEKLYYYICIIYFNLNKKYSENIFSIYLVYIITNIDYRNPINPKIFTNYKYAYLKFNIYLINIIVYLNSIFALIIKGIFIS